MIAVLASALLAVPAFIFALECILGLRPLRPASAAGEPPPFAVLVPAHDEARGIEATIKAVRAQLRREDRVVVVADNCSDDTAELARNAGAMVVERHDLDRRGKGFALEFGRNALGAAPPSVVIVLDADCEMQKGGFEILAALSARKKAAVQALNLVEPHRDASPIVAISSFAFMVRNQIRQRGLARLSAPALLQGTGMAFPWEIFAEAPLASADIVEDLNIGLALVRQGHDVVWTEATRVTSLHASQEGTTCQRTRWEHGSMTAAVRNIPRLVGSAFVQRRLAPAWLAADLLVPPLALLVAILGIAWIIALAAAFAGEAATPLAILTAAMASIVVSVLLAWASEGRWMLPFRTLLSVPIYIIWKLPIYASLLGRRQKTWVRTARE